MKQIRGKLTYANVVATIALFIAVGGASAFAATQLAKNSVGSKQLKNNAVTTAKIKKGAVTGDKIKLSSLGTVPSAGNAQTVGGLTPAQIAETSKLKCPSGTALAAGVCVETSPRLAASFPTASQTCGEANRFLPSMGELIAYLAQFATSPPPDEWIGQMYLDTPNFRGMVVTTNKGGAVSTASALFNEAEPYRCALVPTN